MADQIVGLAKNNLDLAVMMLAALLLFIFMFVGRPRNAIQRSEGVVLVMGYALYMVSLVYRG